jgi:maltose O-acetyltransferase
MPDGSLLRMLRAAMQNATIREALLNGVAGSVFMPRRLRVAILNAAGTSIHTQLVSPGCWLTGTRLSVGEGTYIGPRCMFDVGGEQITIGRNCLLAMEVLIGASSHETRWPRAHSTAPVVVEDHCWLGARSVILPGSLVATGCIVAAGAVVRGQLEPWSVYAGIPARRVRDLDPGERIPPGGDAPLIDMAR